MRDFQHPGRSAVFATNGICATSTPLASQVAIDVLRRGGNAVDAAIAGAVLLGLAEPQMTGIGGDCFALISPAGGEDVIAVNGSGRAPAAASAAALRDQGLKTVPTDSAHAVTIPGAIDAFCTMSENWGKLGLADSLAPAIHYMRDGVPIAPRTVFDWRIAENALQGAARDHYLLGGKTPNVGDIFRLPGQADVLERIAKDGRKAFYEGEVAEDMVAALTAAGGVHTLDDFAATKCTIGEPLAGHYKGRELLEHPPNGQGVTAHLMLNILSQFDLASMDPFGAERAHIEAETAKLAYDARNRFLADPAHMTRLDHLTSMETAQKLAALIDPNRAMASATSISESVHKETIYITVVDKDRMSVSLIYSVFHSFGSGIASDKFGILFQNRGAGFSLEQGHANEMAGGKRPMHTIIPAMVRDAGRVTMPFGVMGGQYQPNGHARVMTNLTDYGLDPQAALDAPRSFPQDGKLQVERGYSDKVRAELAAKGHDVEIPETAIGGAQAILIHDNGVLEGASDPRKDGCAIGY
ncbi:gamma-glutamyltransferase family protein [Tropicibacter naphthalenivorans]|uniref:Putative gamma-glutamyltransferase YwrD n=1 Tax=Tropicibacter naphthalenivorans TaxID=441103 RepID=A0A0P1G1S1_9RHOB|nr:gamma-glutamyltransferase family protein [Tropicibacter naphthalenivorans]CUH75522.1 Putative gamma-glutamyltransferase YwrD [Tropicibacter naphthalenivorans]SMC43927.1 gamma-glutamyltransferase 2. Threonine peptidase. MEROPS family T03 [Tropicibacter naphthalenivorans]